MAYKYELLNGVSKVKTKLAITFSALGVGTAGVVVAVAMPLAARASTVNNLVVTPTSTGVFSDEDVTGIPNDSAPGFAYGSIASGGTNKTDMEFTPQTLFGHDVSLGDISSISYWTKTGSNHTVSPQDWSLVIYTKPYAGDKSSASWYGERIGAEPYFSVNLNDPANTWNEWSTNSSQNQLRFYESTAGAPNANFGTYTDPTWSTFLSDTPLSGVSTYSSHDVQSLSLQTGSAWASGFTGQVDGLQITLNDGSVANVNFEPFSVATDKNACMQGGWQNLKDSSGNSFRNQGDCVSFVATDGRNTASTKIH
jgi:hypothetical protein